jgi:hypothetical protein
MASLASLPQLLPDLYELLDRASAGDTIIHHAAAGICGVVGLKGGATAEARQAASQLLEILRAHDFLVSNIGSASHDGQNRIIFAICSPHFSLGLSSQRWLDFAKVQAQNASA